MAFDVTVIGGGIVGLATALKVQERWPDKRVCVLEKDPCLAGHQTGNNSGVIHSGLYYKPGSAKAQTCVEGARRMLEFCQKHKIAHQICGKVVVATCEDELPRLDELYRRGQANAVPGIEQIGPERLREIEPYAAGIKALFVPGTAIVNYAAVAEKYAQLIRQNGGTVEINCKVLGMRCNQQVALLQTWRGDVQTRLVVNCAGLHSDRVARLTGAKPDARIVPFRGEYYVLLPARQNLVKGLIYPVPDPRFPFLGVHFTRMIDGSVECGPNAVLALQREGYLKTSFNLRDAWETFSYPGFWRMARRYWLTGCGEFYRSFSKRAFVKALRRLVPELRGAYLAPGGSGVRAQALLNDGALVDDFRIVRHEQVINVLNAPSPAATASLCIGQQIAAMVGD